MIDKSYESCSYYLLNRCMWRDIYDRAMANGVLYPYDFFEFLALNYQAPHPIPEVENSVND